MNSTQCDPMQNAADSSKAVILPPIAWALAVVTGVGLDWLRLVPLVAPFALAPWIGGAVFATGLALAIWSRTTLGKVGTPMESGKPTTAVAMSGPYGFSRNPIYVGMLLGQTGLAIGLNNAWLQRLRRNESPGRTEP